VIEHVHEMLGRTVVVVRGHALVHVPVPGE
jgi:hypothetical protein